MRATKRVRVHPRDDTVRRDILHPPSGVRFPAEGSAEWPLDQFTKRRLRDGTVRLESEQDKQARDEQHAREREARAAERRQPQPQRQQRQHPATD